MVVKGLPAPLQKLWVFVTTYILTLKRFDLFLQGALLILVLLDTNVTLLLKRDASKGHVPGNIHDWVQVGASVVEFTFGALIAWWG
ncbi:uncharacterized protein [Choristoneura fumiferana]|uniref:uncharacterized protein n=1 Tax=Choristoneura fumiferana TaxID=7141 RepID=UPI003D15CF05